MKMKQTDKNIGLKFRLFPVILIFLVGCVEPDVNFQINGSYALTGAESDEEILNPDTAEMLRVFVGDTVIFRNTTEPEDQIKSQRWDIDGDEVIDEEFDGRSGFKTVYTKPDRFMAALWVNDAEIPVKKWIEVKGEYKVIDDFNPTITFITPADKRSETEDMSYGLKASLNEIYSSDSIVLLLNGKKADFTFDEITGVLASDLRLTKGSNEIELAAYTDDGEMYAEMVLIEYKIESIASESTPYVPPAQNKKNTVVETKSNNIPPPAGKPKTDPKPNTEETKKNLNEFAKAGYRSDGVNETCRDELIEKYSFTITPSRLIRLDDFVIFNTVCGNIEITISSKDGELLSSVETLTEGKSQISFGLFNEVLMQKGREYTISLKPISGNSNCGSTDAPKLVDTKACSPQLRKKSHLTTNFKGKSIIHDITYSY
jgi:hypothetical protein